MFYLVLMIIFIYILVACWLLFCSIGFFVTDANLKCWSFFFSLDSITMMKVKLLSTMHLRELDDASIFTLYAIWFVDMTLCVLLYFELNECILFSEHFFSAFAFPFITNVLSIVTAMNINIYCLFFFLY